MTEKWLPVKNEPDYEVSSEGCIRRATDGIATWAGRILVGGVDTHGYRSIAIGPGHKRRRVWVHTAVAEAFHGDRPDGMLINHINEIRSDNRAINLEWVTRSGNVRHGERVVTSKLNQQAVKVIRYVLANRNKRGTQLLLARLHGVTHEAIRKIGDGRTWGGGVSSLG